MRVCHDLAADALYIRFRHSQDVKTHFIDAGTLVDADSEGTVLGIEILKPKREWPIKRILKEFDLTEDQQRLLFRLADVANPTIEQRLFVSTQTPQSLLGEPTRRIVQA
ncbi:MAG: DUF2283 domain-containing protein [bacterium]|nr:DUF2283 domain-containing protein [bacterium]